MLSDASFFSRVDVKKHPKSFFSGWFQFYTRMPEKENETKKKGKNKKEKRTKKSKGGGRRIVSLTFFSSFLFFFSQWKRVEKEEKDSFKERVILCFFELTLCSIPFLFAEKKKVRI